MNMLSVFKIDTYKKSILHNARIAINKFCGYKKLFCYISFLIVVIISMFFLYMPNIQVLFYKDKNNFVKSLNLYEMCYVVDNLKENNINNKSYKNKLNKIVCCGNKIFVYSNLVDISLLNNSCYIQGKYKNNIDELEKKLRKYNFIKIHTEKFGDYTIFYYYSNCINDYKILGFKKVNLQIALKNNEIILGCPLIYGSF